MVLYLFEILNMFVLDLHETFAELEHHLVSLPHLREVRLVSVDSNYVFSTFYAIGLLNHDSMEDAYDQLLNGCKGVPECQYALYRPAKTYEALCTELRASIATMSPQEHRVRFQNHQEMFIQHQSPKQTMLQTPDRGKEEIEDEDPDIFYVDRIFKRNQNMRYRGRGRPATRFAMRARGGSYRGSGKSQPNKRRGPCFVCQKQGCWSDQHTDEERRISFQKYKASQPSHYLQEDVIEMYMYAVDDWEGTDHVNNDLKV